eukprot:3210581-Amphidinium_carterae.4
MVLTAGGTASSCSSYSVACRVLTAADTPSFCSSSFVVPVIYRMNEWHALQVGTWTWTWTMLVALLSLTQRASEALAVELFMSLRCALARATCNACAQTKELLATRDAVVL